MMVYIYDGSFEGLLSAVYDAYYTDPKPDRICSKGEYEINFLYEEKQIDTSEIKYRKVSQAIRTKMSELAMEKIYHAYLSELPEVSTHIYAYIRLGFHVGRAITDMHTNDIVKRVHDNALKTAGEKHRLLGLLRFKRIKGDIYYAAMKPDHNVLALLAPHFEDRLADQRWIIHDLKREIAAIYDKNTWIIRTLSNGTADDRADTSHLLGDGTGRHRHITGSLVPFNPNNFQDTDLDYENLWRLYHKHISIETKRNIKLQRQMMPSRYWHFLTEKQFY